MSRAATEKPSKPTPKLGEAFGRAIRTDRYRLIEWTGPKSPAPVCELYDHETGPHENTNVAGRPENAEIVESLAEQLHQETRAAGGFQ